MLQILSLLCYDHSVMYFAGVVIVDPVLENLSAYKSHGL